MHTTRRAARSPARRLPPPQTRGSNPADRQAQRVHRTQKPDPAVQFPPPAEALAGVDQQSRDGQAGGGRRNGRRQSHRQPALGRGQMPPAEQSHPDANPAERLGCAAP